MKKVLLLSFLLTSILLGNNHVYAVDAKSSENQPIRLSESQIIFGFSQIEQMENDRPGMSEFATNCPNFRQWVAKQFAGEYTGKPILWNKNPPGTKEVSLGSHGVFEDGQQWVSVSKVDAKNYLLASEKQWAILCVQLMCARYTSNYARITGQAMMSEIDKLGFIRSYSKQDYIANQKLTLLFNKIFRKEFQRNGQTVVLKNWIRANTSFDDWLKKQERTKSGYAYSYDREVVPFISSQKQKK